MGLINHHLVVFIQHDPSELRGLKSWTLAKIELSLYCSWNPELVNIIGAAARYRRVKVSSTYDGVHPDNSTLNTGKIYSFPLQINTCVLLLQGRLVPRKISDVGTIFGPLDYVLPGPNKQRARKPSIL